MPGSQGPGRGPHRRLGGWLADAGVPLRGRCRRRDFAGRRALQPRVHVWHQYTVRVPDDAVFTRDEAIERLTAAGVGTGVYYPVPAHQQGYIVDCLGRTRLPVTEKLDRQVFSLPVHPQLSQADLETIVSAVNAL